MKIIGLTGPSGAGKGFCYSLFSKHDIPCIDTDKVYHDLLAPPSSCVDELVVTFGAEILDQSGTVNRKKLADIVFSDESKSKLECLNKITHKFVLEKTKRLIESYEQDNKKAVVVDAPLLFEANFDKFCDFSIAVICDTSIRLKRIMTRDSITEEAALMRINSQNPDDFYTTRAKYTVCNDCDKAALDRRLEGILRLEKIL